MPPARRMSRRRSPVVLPPPLVGDPTGRSLNGRPTTAFSRTPDRSGRAATADDGPDLPLGDDQACRRDGRDDGSRREGRPRPPDPTRTPARSSVECSGRYPLPQRSSIARAAAFAVTPPPARGRAGPQGRPARSTWSVRSAAAGRRDGIGQPASTRRSGEIVMLYEYTSTVVRCQSEGPRGTGSVRGSIARTTVRITKSLREARDAARS